jgi:hypothetical protein
MEANGVKDTGNIAFCKLVSKRAINKNRKAIPCGNSD